MTGLGYGALLDGGKWVASLVIGLIVARFVIYTFRLDEELQHWAEMTRVWLGIA
jgi:hypothetical protein